MFKRILLAVLMAGSLGAAAQNDAPVTTTFNMDYVGITERLNTAIVEVNRAQSCNVANIIDADRNRWNGYITALITHLTTIQSRPVLDLPESHPHLMDLPPVPPVQITNNSTCNDIVRYLLVARDEFTASGSTDFASNVSDADGNRLTAVLNQITAIIASAVAEDLPESLNSKPSVLPGSRGPAIQTPGQ